MNGTTKASTSGMFAKRMRSAVVSGSLLLLAATAGAFSAGPQDGRTNAPGETNCTACHATFPLNSGTGSLAITNLPAAYTPGQNYLLNVSLQDPAAQRWGFELTLLDQAGVSAGTLAAVDVTVQISTGGPFGRTYAKHTSSGNFLGQTGGASWLVSWTAPAAGAGDLRLYIAGNAANGSFDNTGDRIYATNFPIPESTATDAPPLATADLRQNRPNPFNPRTEIAFDLARDGRVALTVHALDGRRVATLVDGLLGAGPHRADWDGRDDAGQGVASGTYVYRLTTAAGSVVRRMTLLR